MPPRADWEPPYPAWSAVLPDDTKRVVMAYYAIQHADNDQDLDTFVGWMRERTAAAHAPVVVNRARHRTAANLQEDLFILYWLDDASFRAWEAGSASFWEDPARLGGASGYWREIWQPPLSYLETLISSECPAGLAEAKKDIRGPVREHAYWGAARDRIPQSDGDELRPDYDKPLRYNSTLDSRGRRVRVTPPGNLCLIRSGQNWSACGAEEQAIYDSDLRPVLQAGMDFLRDHGEETGCLSCRFMEELSVTGEAAQKSFGLASFLSLRHLEDWAKSHPTHLAIFQNFHEFVRKRNFQPDLKLWHEVAVMPEGTAFGEYLNCAPATGLLPWFPAAPL